MAVPINNAKLTDIQKEFGGDTLDGGISLTEYYKGGQNVPIGQLPSIYSKGIVPVEPNYYWSDPVNPPPAPVYQEISIGNFLGMEKLLSIDVVISQSLLSGFNLRSYITSNYPTWDGKTPVKVKVTINAGVYIIGADTESTTYAFDASGPFPTKSSLEIINNGVISGRGGNGGNGGRYPNLNPTAGGNGGRGLNASGIDTKIQNNGMIAGGGGGGGGGASVVSVSWLPIAGDGGGSYGVFTHWSGNGGGGGCPLGAGGESGGTCGELTDADLALIQTTRDVEGGYYWGTKFWASPNPGFAGNSATLTNRGTGYYPQIGGDSFFGDSSYLAKWHSADGADYGMEGLVAGFVPSNKPSVDATYPYYGNPGEFTTESAKFGGSRGKSIVGGDRIIWNNYGDIRGDVDDWGYYISRTGQSQVLRDQMSMPSYYISETRRVSGWGVYWDTTYYSAESTTCNGVTYPAPNGDKRYKTFLTMPVETMVLLRGLCDDNLSYIKVNGVLINYSTFAINGSGGWNATGNKAFSYAYDYKTSGFVVPAGVSVIEIGVTHTNGTPHMFDISVQNMYNTTLKNPKQWFRG